MDPSLASRIHAANAALIVDGNLDAVAEYFTPDYVVHGTERDVVGHDAIRSFLRSLRAAVPDVEVEVEILLEGNDRVAWQRTLSGTQKRAFMRFPATGRRIVWRDMFVSRFQDDRFAEDWVVTDLAERLLRARQKR